MGNTTDMTVGSPTQGILRFALPLILGYILQQMYLVIDAAIVRALKKSPFFMTKTENAYDL